MGQHIKEALGGLVHVHVIPKSSVVGMMHSHAKVCWLRVHKPLVCPVVGLLRLHVWVCWIRGRWAGGVWCGSRPSCGCLCPNSSEIVLGICGIGATTSGDPGLGFPRYDGVVGDANSSGVVHLDGSVWLWPTHSIEGLSERDHFLGGGVESS